MSKATTAIVSPLVVACVFALARCFAALVGSTAVSVAFLLLALVVIIAGKSRWRGTPGKRWLLRYVAAGLMVPLGCGVSWASFSLTFQGLVRPLATAGITLGSTGDVVVDTAGDVYIVDTGNNRIVEVNALGVASVVTITGLTPALSSPSGIAVDGSGNLYISDTGNSRVVEITAAGVGSAISTGSVNLSSPRGVALDQSGDIFVSDTGNNRIVEITAGGVAAALTITVSSGSATLSSPLGLAVDVTGKLYIADSNHNRIVTVAAGSTTGVVVSILGGVTLSHPQAVTVDRMGNVFIADGSNNRIAEIDTSSNGTVLYIGSETLNVPTGVALDVFGTVYIADFFNNRVLVVDPPVNADVMAGDSTYSLNRTAVGFGHVQLGSSSPVTLTLTFTTESSGLGSVQVLTSGVPSLDFISGSDTTCNSSTGPSSVCVVEVTFLPTAPGLRTGSVVLYDESANPILSVPLYGWGDSPVAALGPNTGTVINAGGLTLSNPFQVALDGAGNIYVGDYSGKNVTRIPAGGGSAVLVALGTPGSIAVQNITGVAVDGAGNLFIGDHQNSRILVVTPGGVVSVLSITGLSPALGFPVALALDGAGNLFISDFTNGRIIRVSTLVVAGSTSSGLGVVIGTGSFSFGGSTLTGMTVDAQGNIYAAARTQNSSSIIKVTTAGVASELSFPGITPAISNPQGVAVDAMGNVFVVDTGNTRIVRLTTAGVASALSISGMPAPSTLGSTLFGTTLDPLGNLYIPDWTNNRIVLANVSGATLAFPNTNVGSTSATRTATVANLGDLPLIFATVPSYTVNFSEDSGDENLCALGTSLAAGTLCDVAIEFTPQSAGSLSTGIVVTDNSLNLTATTQDLAVSGTGIAVADSTAVAVSTAPTSVVLGQAITIAAIVTDTTAGHAATIPTGGMTFMDTVGSTTISLNGGTAVALNGSGTAILAGVTLAGVGTHTITANYVGVAGVFATSSNTTTIPVAAAPIVPTINWTPPSGAIPYGTTLSGILDASATSGSTTVAGSFTYTATLAGGSPIAVTGTTVLGVGSYTLTATFTPTDTTTYASASATESLTVAKAAPTVTLISSANPAVVAATVTFTATVSSSAGAPSGSVSFYDGTTLLGSGTLALGVAAYATSGLALGAHSITAAYGGNTNFSALSSSVLSETVTAPATITTTTTLTASPNPLADGQPATLTATVTPAPTGTPAGIISFYSGTTLLGTGTLNASGVATFTASSLVVGADSITAVYPGNTGFAASTSSAISLTVTTAYTVTAPTTPVPVAPGGAAIIDITVPPLGGAFNNVVTLSASGLPPGATATFNPPTVTPGSTGAPTVMTIQLATLAASIPAREVPANHRGLPVAPLSLGFVLFGAVLGRKRIPKALALVLALASLGVGTALLTGCSGGFANTPSTPAGSYTVTVTGTSGSFQASTTMTLVVQ